jgi:hypothetical protein
MCERIKLDWSTLSAMILPGCAGIPQVTYQQPFDGRINGYPRGATRHSPGGGAVRSTTALDMCRNLLTLSYNIHDSSWEVAPSVHASVV